MARDFIAINWGSSNFRSFLLGDEGAVCDAFAEPAGIASLDRSGMEAQLARLVARWPDAGMIYACGMVGSNVGWEDAGYVACPIGLEELAARLHPATIAGRTMHIVPGLACRRAVDNAPDIMRGEETELFGLLRAGRLPQDGIVALPGTHGKWVRIEGGKVQEFMTAMSGEIFDRLTAAGMLASVVAAPAATGAAFKAGVDAGFKRQPGLGTALFGVRAQVIRGDLARDDAASYLRGLLIGSELADARAIYPLEPTVTLVGAAPVCALYAAALAHVGIGSQAVDAADATAQGFAGIHAARRALA
ncbi:2-dehydro-3-deoxygalactonokinase [Luteibacter aegosomatissinici]|uniref:2-dehydro-3-deoxygalactonokinase n=1 Tax=Luteibacter aegosomatissinici TaxID=2911539 RepID=UPI001FFB8ECF|nr:2-dehydro-3-deoxygalactonokinase [Luteibacter aegosomatissinici]UPG94588.1 2-dehydro-3-deoxygalactonokinase [Luteibacter aegosomatissinici]